MISEMCTDGIFSARFLLFLSFFLSDKHFYIIFPEFYIFLLYLQRL